MIRKKSTVKAAVVAGLVLGVSSLHALGHDGPHYYRAFYGELYFVPLVLAGLWFGLRGALATSLGITAFFLPFTWATWNPVPPHGLEHLLEVLLFNGMALLLGLLRNREAAAQEQARAAQTLSMMGEAVAAAAHDMRSPLTAIGGFATLAMRDLPETSPARNHMVTVTQEVRRLEALTENMLDFSRPLELAQRPEDMNPLAARAVAVVEVGAMERSVRVEIQLTPELPPLRVDPGRLEQVLINLLRNAVEASPDGGTVTMCTALKGSNVLLEVVDAGAGLPPEKELEELFRPFVTTKCRGTGLGLPIARKIVTAHGGQLDILNNPGRGVTARVTLPLE